MCGRSPAQVSKDQVVPDVDTDEVGGVEGGSIPAVPRHLGQKSEETWFLFDIYTNKDLSTVRDFSTSVNKVALSWRSLKIFI